MFNYSYQIKGYGPKHRGFLLQNLHPAFQREPGGKYSRNGGVSSPVQSITPLCLSIVLVVFLAGCITDATVDVTKAPFDASTELTDATTGAITQLTDGTSQATTDLTDPTREFLSSTTPGAWFHKDGTANPSYEKIAFVVLNFDNLREDMAHGEGEYLYSFATLAGVPLHSRENFMKFSQSRYGFIFEEGQSRPDCVRRLLNTLQGSTFFS